MSYNPAKDVKIYIALAWAIMSILIFGGGILYDVIVQAIFDFAIVYSMLYVVSFVYKRVVGRVRVLRN